MDLDAMLNPTQAARWLQMSERELARKSRGKFPKIPAFRMGKRTVLYHPRTVIAHMQQRAGISAAVLAAIGSNGNGMTKK